MLHDPVHFVVFLIILAILPLELYLLFLIFVLYTYLKEAYIDVSYNTNINISANISNDHVQSILGRGVEGNEAGLTSGGRRISI